MSVGDPPPPEMFRGEAVRNTPQAQVQLTDDIIDAMNKTIAHRETDIANLKAENELLKGMLADANKMLVGSQLRK